MNKKRKTDMDSAHQDETINKSLVYFRTNDLMSFRTTKKARV